MSIFLSYTLGILVGAICTSLLIKSRMFYHINTFDLNAIFKKEKKEKLDWMV
tara:strand:+ start:493 stop:648 length:156 start_codon:yes stop_codon:yes gene_type:complete